MININENNKVKAPKSGILILSGTSSTPKYGYTFQDVILGLISKILQNGDLM